MFADFSTFQLIVFIIALLIGMSLHEAMHSFVAHWLGDTTAKDEGRLSINPLKHIDLATTVALPVVMVMMGLPPFMAAKPVPFNPERVRFGEYGAALVGLAGPLTNLVLAGLTAGFLRIFENSLGETGIMIGVMFVAVNIAFFVFNMIPLPPLDGSRLLYAFAPRPLQRFMESIERFGLFAILLFVIILLPVISPYYVAIMEFLYNLLLGI